MEKRYLINNKIYGSSTEKPHHSAPNYIGLNWMDKLKELACDESEYNKIASHLGWKTLELNPIDITSITTVKDCETYKLDECNSRFACCNSPKKVYFKEMESESNKAEIDIWHEMDIDYNNRSFEDLMKDYKLIRRNI